MLERDIYDPWQLSRLLRLSRHPIGHVTSWPCRTLYVGVVLGCMYEVVVREESFIILLLWINIIANSRYIDEFWYGMSQAYNPGTIAPRPDFLCTPKGAARPRVGWPSVHIDPARVHHYNIHYTYRPTVYGECAGYWIWWAECIIL